MGAKDLKLTAVLVDKVSAGLKQAAQDWRRAVEEPAKAATETAKVESEKLVDNYKASTDKRIALQRNSIAVDESLRAKQAANYESWWQKTLKTEEAAEQKRIALQRNSIVLQEKMEAQKQQQATLSQNKLRAGEKNAADTALRIERQAAIAESSMVVDRFDRRIAIEHAKHAQILADLKGNDSAQEAEVRRHNAVVSRITMDKANLPNTPFQQLLGGIKQGMGFQDGVAGVAAMAGGAIAATFAFSKLTEAVSGSVDAALQMQTIRQTLDYASGSAKNGAEDFKYLEDEALRLGVSIKATAPEFGRMEAAAKGTTLAGKGVRDIFSGMSEAAVTLHLDTEQTSRGFYALQEMISMGSVQTRQLRMLALSLPGAFNLAAQSMGVTTSEIMKMMEHGKVATTDFLPKFAKALHETYGEAAKDASENSRQSIQKFNNAVFESASAVGNVFLNAMGMGARAILKIGDAYDAASVAAQRARKEAFNANMMAGKFANYGDDAAAQTVKAGSAIDLFNKKLQDSYAKAHPVAAAVHVDTAEQIANQIKLEQELQVARAEARQDGEAEQLAQESMRYQREKDHLLGSTKEKELLEQIHVDKVTAIHKEAAKKLAEEEDKANGARYTKIRDDEKKEQAFLVDSNQKAMDQLAELKKKNGAGDLKTAGKDGSGLAGKQAALEQERLLDLADNKRKFGDTEAYNELVYQINLEYANKNKALIAEDKRTTAELFAAKAGYYEQYANSVSQMIGIIGGKSKTAFALQQGIAEAEIAVRTASAVVTDSSNPLTWWKVPYDIALGAAQGAVVAGTAIKGFAGGTDYAPGGMAWVGEQGPELINLPRGSQVHTASESAQMARGGGGNSTTIHAPISIHMASGSTQADANRVADAVGRELRKLRTNEKNATYLGYQA